MPFIQLTYLDQDELANLPVVLDEFLSDGKHYIANFFFTRLSENNSVESDLIINAEFPVIEEAFKAALIKYPNLTVGEVKPTTLFLVKCTIISEVKP